MIMMMHMVRRTVRASACATCQLSILRSFTAIAGISFSTNPSPSRQLPRSRRQTRAFSNGVSQEGVPETHSLDESRFVGLGSEDINLADEQEKPSANNSTPQPWYLQVDAPLRASQPMVKGQELPELPESPPDILQPLLQQLSIEIGLDDLKILDLRNLDPPPALGANLLMILGTARSEKHLHVSADRLCRWLRSTYKLRPDADGLLGRNELKLKLKRKARRAKLVGNGSPEEDADDGIRTGWVCVNVGTVEESRHVRDAPAKRDFIGFGRQTEGIKIVVQMLTEEKRAEIDLERLWSGIVKRQSLAETEVEDIHNHAPAPNDPGLQLMKSNVTSLLPSSAQSRGIHTSACYRMISSHPSNAIVGLPILKEHLYTSLDLLQPAVSCAIELGDYNAARSLLLEYRDVFIDLRGDGWRLYILQSLRQYLEALPPTEAREKIGANSLDHSSTPFLSFFYQIISTFPNQTDLEFQIWLYSFARRLQHDGYSVGGLAIMFENLQLCGVTLPSRLWVELLRTVLWPDNLSSAPQVSSEQLDLVIQILRYMEASGKTPMSQEIIVALVEAITPYVRGNLGLVDLEVPDGAAIQTYDLPVIERSSVQSRLVTLLFEMNVLFTQDIWRIRLLNAFAKQYDWKSFWLFWRTQARKGTPRSEALYACMFYSVALTGHQKGCMTVLRSWIPEMELESPKVEMQDEVSDGIRACLKVIDPAIERLAERSNKASGEWIDLWKCCQRTLRK